MSITSPDDRISTYNPVVATTEFSAGFPIFDNDDLAVYHDGVERTDFTVSATYIAGVANDARAVFAIGITGKVQVVGARDPRRTNQFNPGAPLPTRDLNLAINTTTAEGQEARRDIQRAFKAPYGVAPPPVPEPGVQKVIGWDENGNLVNIDPAEFVNDAGFATAAQGSKADTALQPAAIGVSVQGFNATLAALSSPSTPQSTETRTATLRLPITGTGVVVAVGGNKVRLATGLQIGGGVDSEGTDGTIAKVSGHASWLDLWPSKNYSSLEFAINTTFAAFEATATIGGNTLTRLQGSVLDAAWVGRKIYFNYGVYKVSAVAGSTVTVTTTGGGAVSWPATVTEVARVGGIAGSGTCNVSGTTVTRVSGDPFLIYLSSGSFTTVINGTTVTVLAASEDSLTLSASLGTLNGVAFTFNGDVNDQIATARVHGSNQDIENISIYSRYDGYWIESQYGAYGKYRPIYISSGEITAGVKRQQVTVYDTGRVTIGGPAARCAVNVEPVGSSDVNYFGVASAPTGFGPSIRARGGDPNVTFGIDMQGTGSLTVTNGGFARTIFGANGGATATAYIEVNAGVGIADISGKGSATNIDVQLTPRGTGNVRFGTFTSNADAPVNGYITIKDAAGNTRKLATIA